MNSQKWIASVIVAAVVVLMSGCGSSKTVTDQSQRPQAAVYNMQLATDYFRQGNLSMAKEKIERALEQDSHNAQAHMLAGLLFQRLGEIDQAEEHLSRAVSLSPKDSEMSNSYAQFLCSRGKFDRGKKMFLAVASDPLYKTPETAFVNAGHCVRNGGSVKDAEQYYRRALELRQNYAPALMAMTDLELEQKQPLLARAFLERFFGASAASPAALLLGVKIETTLGNQAQANDYARRLRDDFPNSEENRTLRDASKSR
jgi:type IV pilus assembly protein PilF